MTTLRTRPRHIAIEGIDGSGKSTLAMALAKALGAAYCRRPSDGPIGTLARAALQEPIFADDTIRLLMRADSVECAIRAKALLANPDARLVSDRSCWSGIAYGDPHAMDTELVCYPDLVIWLDLPPADALARCMGRGGELSCYETLGTLTDVRLRYAKLAREEDRWTKVDAEGKTPDELLALVMCVVLP